MNTPIGARIPSKLRVEGIPRISELLKSIGLTAIDLPEINEEIAEVCRRNALTIGTVDLKDVAQTISCDSDKRKRAVESVCYQIAQISRLGGKAAFVCLVPEDVYQPIAASLEYFEESFPDIAKTCEENGVRIAIEGWPGPGPHYPTLGYTPEVWRAMFRAVPSSALGLCFDPSHLIRLGIDYLRVFDEFSERIVHCHGKDTELLHEQQYLYGNMAARLDATPAFSEGSWRYCIPGTGEVDWARVAYRLQRIDYKGCVSIELEDARYSGTLDNELNGIRKAYAHLSGHLS
ncbi:sugar phosphate isomerase/epimerase family protein [Alicyclobacillus suci]|uniref:sugar phosphate isomerase/epimerase family protein n=1 Tax=Alicyclobacillus suci TaxID=2816080 RepID=UPI001A8C29B1|nr:sugar phosphate isomerase/epimerase [Alicyclobacillus suci]